MEEQEGQDEVGASGQGFEEDFDEVSGPRHALDDLKIAAQLRIGTMVLPLRSILTMKVGEVLPLDRSLKAPVQVLAGGRTVASGELVASNGFYAVKITEVSELERHLPADVALN